MCNSGCRSSIAGTRPSSAVQLPITATLYAEHLTLFADIIHHLPANVNRENIDITKSIPKGLSEYPGKDIFSLVSAEQMCYYIN